MRKDLYDYDDDDGDEPMLSRYCKTDKGFSLIKN